MTKQVEPNRFDPPDEWRLSHFFQAIPAYFFYGLFKCLPLDWASALGGWIGRTVGPRLGASRKAKRNLDYVLPELKDQHPQIIREMWDNLGRVIAEVPHASKFIHSGRITIDGFEYIRKLQEEKIPAILFSSHSANWEMGPIILSENELPFSIVYRPPNNLFINWLLNHTRGSVYPDLLPKGTQAARGVLKTLLKKGYVGWLVDQKESAGVKLNFFGKPAYTSTAAAEIALKTGAKLIPTHLERLNGAHFNLTLYPPIETEGKDAAQVTQIMNDALEKGIRNNPGQWLWIHRRWKI